MVRIHQRAPSQTSVHQRFSSRLLVVAAIRERCGFGLLCNGLQQPSLLVHPAHRFFDALIGRVQVGARLLQIRVRAFHAASGERYGRPRLWKDLREDGEAVSEKRVGRLMREEQIQGQVPKRFKQTTDSTHDDPIAANLLDRDFTAAAPNQRWVGDTTEFVIGEHAKLYLAVILDLYSRFVVGWAISAVK